MEVDVETGVVTFKKYVVAHDIGSHASRSTYVTGNAVIDAGKKIKTKLLEFGAKRLEVNADDLDVSEGSIVNLEFNLPLTKQPIKVKGLVLRSNDEGAGIRFLTLDINDFATIDDYVQNQLS